MLRPPLPPLPPLVLGVLEDGFEDVVKVVGVYIVSGVVLDDKTLVLDIVLVVVVEVVDGLEGVVWEDGKVL